MISSRQLLCGVELVVLASGKCSVRMKTLNRIRKGSIAYWGICAQSSFGATALVNIDCLILQAGLDDTGRSYHFFFFPLK